MEARSRRLIEIDTHQAAFGWVLTALSKAGLVRGKTIGVDATTLEAHHISPVTITGPRALLAIATQAPKPSQASIGLTI